MMESFVGLLEVGLTILGVVFTVTGVLLAAVGWTKLSNATASLQENFAKELAAAEQKATRAGELLTTVQGLEAEARGQIDAACARADETRKQLQSELARLSVELEGIRAEEVQLADIERRYAALKEGAAAAMGKLTALGQLLNGEHLAIIGKEAPRELEEAATARDADRELVVARALRLLDDLPRRTLADYLVKLGCYWRQEGEFALATRRFKEATEADPENPNAWEQLGRTYTYYVASFRDQLAAEEKRRLLERSREATSRTQEIRGAVTVWTAQDVASAVDEEARLTGDFSRAIAAWESALALAVSQEQLAGGAPVAGATLTFRDSRRAISQNLVCSLVCSGDLARATATLAKLKAEFSLPEELREIEEWLKLDDDTAPIRDGRKS